MYYKFDVKKWALQLLPMVLRKRILFAFVKCCVHAISEVAENYYTYCNSVDRQLGHNANTLMLQKWLNDLFYLEDAIYISNYQNELMYLHYQDETLEEVYLSYKSEGKAIYLDSKAPSNEYGGFVVKIPAEIATVENIATIKQWVEFYKTAGVVYKIEQYG